MNSKEGNASKASLFKNVFDSLTLFQDLQHEGGAQEDGGSVPNSPHKKELPADESSGTEEAVVLQIPIAPKTPSQPKPVLMLPQSAHTVMAGNDADREENTDRPTTSASGQSDLEATVKNQPEPAALPMRYLPYSYSPATSTSDPASMKAAEPDTKPAPTKALGTARAPFSTQPVAKPSAGQQLAAVANDPADAAHSIEKPAPADAPATAPTPLATRTATKPRAVQQRAVAANDPADATRSIAKPAAAPDQSAQEKTQKTLAGQPAIAAPQASFPTQASGTVAEPVANFAAPKPDQSSPDLSNKDQLQKGSVAIEARANVQAPAEASQAPSSLSFASKSPDRTTRPDSKPLQSTSSANGQTVSPQPTPVPVPIVTPAPASPSEVLNTPPANERKVSRPSGVSDIAAAASAPTSTLAPVSAGHDVMNQAPETPSSTSSTQHEAWPTIPEPRTPLLPQAENFAFAVRMLGLDSPRHSSLTESKASVTNSETVAPQPKSPVTRPQSSDSQPKPLQSQPSSDTRHETQPAAHETERSDNSGHDPSHLVEPQQTPGVTGHWNDAGVFQTPQHGSVELAPEPAQAARPDLPLAAQESHLLAPELPKTSASSEILLHLTGNDQTSAAIRIADRAGAVNVSVHASDPVLRESLRSNLGDLSNQLSAQGWRTDALKSAPVAAHAGGQQDSHAGGERSSGQQQSNGGDRQPQRERRANGGQWQQELEQQITGGSAHPGGNE